MPRLYGQAENETMWEYRAGLVTKGQAFHWLTGLDPAMAPKAVMVCDARLFRSLEASTGGAGGLLAKRGKAGNLHSALTGVSSQEWVRQRAAITSAVMPRGLGHGRPEAIAEKAAAQVLNRLRALCRGPAGVDYDLKLLLEPALGEWIIELTMGTDEAVEGTTMAQDALEYWRRLRAKDKRIRSKTKDDLWENRVEAYVQRALQKAGAALNGGAGASEACPLLEGMIRNCSEEGGLRPGELTGNCFSFLVAGFETTYTVALFTLLALGGLGSEDLRRGVAAECVMMRGSPEALERQRAVLRELKRAATKGEPLPPECWQSAQGGFLLVRCIAETVRLFPPVWGLPRVLLEEYRAADAASGPASSCPFLASLPDLPKGAWVQADIMCCNGVGPQWPRCWDPTRSWPAEDGVAQLATWGAGERSCPAGTAALLAAWTILRHILAEFSIEANAEQIISKCFLGVTLNLDGPAVARIRPRTGE